MATECEHYNNTGGNVGMSNRQQRRHRRSGTASNAQRGRIDVTAPASVGRDQTIDEIVARLVEDAEHTANGTGQQHSSGPTLLRGLDIGQVFQPLMLALAQKDLPVVLVTGGVRTRNMLAELLSSSRLSCFEVTGLEESEDFLQERVLIVAGDNYRDCLDFQVVGTTQRQRLVMIMGKMVIPWKA
jgi:hypothetical protein